MADTFPTPPKTDWWDTAKRGVSTVMDLTPEGRAAKSAYEKVKGGVPIGDIVQQQVDKGPDDPSRWVLNTIQDLGLISAKAVQGLTTPMNLGLIAAMSAGQEEAALPILAKLGFSGQMAKDAVKSFAQGYQQAKRGNLREAGRLFGSAAVDSLLIALASKKAPKGATYRVSEGEVPKQLAGEVKARPTAKDIPLPTVQDAEIVTPKPPERRLDLATRHEVTDLMAFDKTLTREEAIDAVFKAREAAKNAKPLPRYADTLKAAKIPPPTEPVPPPPDIIQQPRTIKASGEAVTVTPDDVRAYVEARKGGKPVFVVGPKGDRQDLAQAESSESQRIAGHKLTAEQHSDLFPGAKYRAGMTVREAIDQHLEKAKEPTATLQPVPPPPQSPVPPSPTGGDFALTPPGQTGPMLEPGWKTSLGAYDRATASKYLKSYRRNSDDAKLVADPNDPAKFWVAFKPKTAAPPPPKALGPGARKPYEKPTGPKPAPWESRGIFVERRVKELNRQAIDLMQAEKEVPEDVWKELEPLQDELDQNRAEERKEFPQIRPQEPKSREGVSKGTPEARSPAAAPVAPPASPKELTPEQKFELEVNRAGAKWNGVQKDGDEVLGFMFTDPKTNSTLFLTPDKANKADIEKRIAESRAQYDQAKRPGESFEVGTPVKFVPERDGILFAGPKKHPVEYGYIELADAVPSHNAPHFAVNPQHPGQQRVSYEFNPAQRAKLQEHFMNPEPEQLLSDGVTGVEGPPVMTPDGKIAGGNGRTMLYQMLYGSDKAKMIRDAVVASAQKGGAVGVESMRQPIRVRRIKPPDTLGDWMRLTEDLNLNPAAETTAPERAMSIGRRLSPSTMKAVAAGLEDIGPDTTIRDLMTARPVDFVQWLVDDGALATKERIRYIDDETGGLNEEGRALYESAILGATIQDVRLLERGSRSVISKLASSLGPLARLQGRDDEWGITHLITNAAQVVGEAQQRGLKVTDFLAQKALFGEPPPKAVKNLAEFLDRSNPNVKKGLNQFAGEAGMAGGGQGLLGSVVVNPWDSFNEAFVKPVEKGPPMTKAGKPKPESPAERERRERQNAEARKKAQEKYLTQEEYLNAVRESYEQAIRANEEN